MAPRRTPATGNEPQADGAKPGAEVVTPSDKHAFNADGRAAAREAAPVTVGGIDYHRRRKNWAVTRKLRALLRDQERAQTRADRARKALDELPIDTDEATLDQYEEKIDAAIDDSDNTAYEIIALLLRDDDGESPPVGDGTEDDGTLKSELDVEDAGDLAATLAGGGEPDPTPETPSS